MLVLIGSEFPIYAGATDFCWRAHFYPFCWHNVLGRCVGKNVGILASNWHSQKMQRFASARTIGLLLLHNLFLLATHASAHRASGGQKTFSDVGKILSEVKKSVRWQ